MCLLPIFYAQGAVSKSLQCNDKQYVKGSRCCDKCGPGKRVLTDCTDTQPTICVRCSRDEYQPGLTDKTSCIPQKYCDPGKGFMQRPENLVAEEPCPCLPNFKCSPVNCEFCEKILTCSSGFGLESGNGKKTCVPCKKGFFSADDSADQCKQWTNCKAEGRSELRPGSAQTDAVCGPPLSGAGPSWVIVSVLSVITVLCLLILLLFCYKDKLKLLSVNLRSCVQNLKRTRIQQETLAPLYHSGGGIPGGPKCTPCETTKLICQAPHNPTEETPCTFPTSVPEVKVSLPFTREMTEKEGIKEKTTTEDQSEGSGEPEEVSEEEEVTSASPLLASSCVCVIPVHEPLEVGENEDCSQAVNPGTLGTCSCGGLDGDRDGEERKREERKESEKRDGVREMCSRDVVSSRNETGVPALVSLSPPFLNTSSQVHPSSPLPELCLPLSQAQTKLEFRPHLTDGSLLKQEELYRLTSTDSASTDMSEPSTTSAVTSVSPLMTSSFNGDLYLDKPPEYCSPGMSCVDSRENKLSSGDSELECPPESLQSQLAEPTLTSGQVSGNHNTTFISSGQVMNFSGDVIVVYVSQTSLSNDEAGLDDAFGNPVQEQANETAPFYPGSLRSAGDSITHSTLQEETLPVQELMDERLPGKRKGTK